MSARSSTWSGSVVRRAATAVLVVACAAGCLVGVGAAHRAAAATPIGLAGAAPYAVLARGPVSGSGAPSITGDVGGSTVDGLADRVSGATRTGTDIAQALADLDEAADTIASGPVTSTRDSVSGTLTPGTYAVSTAIDLSGGVTLDARGHRDALFVFTTDHSFTSRAGATVTLANGASACNVFWVSDTTATVDGTVAGNVVGRAGITAHRGARVVGRLLARDGPVSLDGTTLAGCNSG